MPQGSYSKEPDKRFCCLPDPVRDPLTLVQPFTNSEPKMPQWSGAETKDPFSKLLERRE